MLGNITTEELKKEIEKREQQKRKEEKPIQLESVDLSSLRKICQEYIDELDEKEYANDDYDHYIYKTALECLYGKNIWKWINKKMR